MMSKRFHWRRLLPWFLALAVLVALTGCGGEQPAGPDRSPNQNSELLAEQPLSRVTVYFADPEGPCLIPLSYDVNPTRDTVWVALEKVLALVEDISATRIDLTQLPFGEYLQNLDWNGIVDKLETWAAVLAGDVVDAVWNFIGALGGALMDLFVGAIFGIYLLVSKEKIICQFKRLVKVWLPEKVGSALMYGASVCSNTFHLFIAGQTLEAVILGSLCAVGMSIINLPYAAMVGVLVGVTALIPYVGAFIGMAVGAFVILTVSPIKALIFVVYLLVLQQVEGNLIYPKVVGAKLNLPAIWVLAAIAVGGNVAGPLGMLAAVPVAASAYIILKETTAKREAAAEKENEAKEEKEE